MKLSKKSLKSKFGKKYQNAGTVTPALPASGPELTYPADVTYGQENLTGAFPTGQPLDDYVAFTRMMNSPSYSNPSEMFKIPAPFGNYTTQNQPQGTISTQDRSFAPGVFSDKQAQNTFTPMMSPLNIYDVDLNTAGVQQGPLTQGEASTREAQGQKIEQPTQSNKKPLDYNSMFTLGLGLTSMGLNQREDQRNRRELNQSIQNRQSQPLYDYNYMYGRTTSGGTEYQPIVKAEMGAQINKRYNSPNSINNVEVEGGEFLQLPDMSTEMAYGPSHSNGGIQTSLPEGTKVFSNHLKPMGSKKTFAQMAKKYDNTEYDKVIDNRFAKQVDKDTAMLMRDKNQKVLDKLFLDQQLINGNSNGEPMNMAMAKNGASINNAGFRALPQAVQEKILSNMEYGGYSLPNPLYMQDGAWYNSQQWDAATGNQNPQSENWYTENQWNNSMQGQPSNQGTPLPDLSNMFPKVMTNNVTQPVRTGVINPFANSTTSPYGGMGTTPLPNFDNMLPQQVAAQPNQVNPFGQSNQSAPQQRQQTQPQTANRKNDASAQSSVPTEDQRKKGLNLYTKSATTEGGISPTGKPVYAQSKSVQDYVAPWVDLIPNALNMTDGEFQSTVYDYALKNDPQSIMNMWSEYGITNKGKADKELMALTKNGKFDAETLKNPEVLAKLKQAYVDNKLGARTLKPSTAPVTPTGETPATATTVEATTETPEQPKGSDYSTTINNPRVGGYQRQPFPLYQAIPGVMGLAGSQEIFPYAIPEIDSPYIRPQTLNIQSQLQDIDNMGQASVRAGADPLGAYIAGIGGKERAFQSKQNFDAQGRMQADQFNAQAQQRADMMNAQLFDQTYNQMIAKARDAATAEQQAAISSLVQNKAKYDQDERLKEFLSPIYAPTYDYNSRTNQTSIVPGQPGFTSSDLTNDMILALRRKEVEAANQRRAEERADQQAQTKKATKTRKSK